MNFGGNSKVAAVAVEIPRCRNLIEMHLVGVGQESLEAPDLVRAEWANDPFLTQMPGQLGLRVKAVGAELAADPQQGDLVVVNVSGVPLVAILG